MSVYLHIPFCLKKCHYCVFPTHIVGTSAQNVDHFRSQIEDQYVSALVKDIKSFLPSSLPLNTLYFGGGTPSLLDRSSLEVRTLCNRKSWNASPSAHRRKSRWKLIPGPSLSPTSKRGGISESTGCRSESSPSRTPLWPNSIGATKKSKSRRRLITSWRFTAHFTAAP